MKKAFFTLTLVLFAVSASFAGNNYVINDDAVDAAFASATEMVMPMVAASTMNPAVPAGKIISFGEDEKDKWIAWALTFTVSFGICGIHRIYLGTSAGVFIGYLLTGGGCGIVQTIDWIVLLIAAVDEESDISKYVNSTKFFMW